MARAETRRKIYVTADWQELEGSRQMGILHAERLRGKEIFSFEYNKEWLQSGQAQMLDPDLQLYSGIQYLNDTEKPNFGLFLDSSPDRWGRVLMRRKESALARLEKRPEETLFETDYLLGVYDAYRVGGLRFQSEAGGAYQNDDPALASPPWTSIRELEQLSMRLEADDAIHDPDYLKWLNMLIAPGSSLGGARPKASVVDKKGQLWIAKFPSKYDQQNIGAWEMVTHELALAAGINMAPSQAKKFTGHHHTFLSKRFDRNERGERLHFASAMTLLGHLDGEDYGSGVSYLELVDFISRQGANITEDLEQLWRRIVFSICVSNADDHLRNHGFMLTPQGWVLSPAYDINPVETATGLKLNISEHDNTLDLDLAMAVHPYFRLKADRAATILNEVKTAAKDWAKIACKFGIPRGEQELKAQAFLRF